MKVVVNALHVEKVTAISKMFLDKIKAQTHTQEDLETMQTFAKVMPMSSLCGLGETAQNALKSAMKIFPNTFKIKN